MVPILAIDSVKRKMKLKRSKLLGGYEFYFAAGVISGALSIPADASMAPEELMGALAGAKAEEGDDEMEYLITAFFECECTPAAAPEYKGLFAAGINFGSERKS